MRIGILSLNPGHNYGGILQLFALQTVLESMGHKVTVICKNRYDKEPDFLHSYKYMSRMLRMIRQKSSWENTVIPERTINDIIRTNIQNTERFMDVYLHRKIYSSLKDIKETDFDCIIVGSDQVWRKNYFEGQYSISIDNAYLSFADKWNIKRIAYAASFGTDEWEYSDDETIRCGRLLRKFNNVTVRECAGVALCKNKFDVTASQMIDPTLILTADDYIEKIAFLPTNEKKKLIVYVLDKNKELGILTERVSKEKNLRIFNIGAESDNILLRNNILPPVEDWLQGFREAGFVITDSFHACVFSVIFRIPFVVIGNKKRGYERFESFLKMLGLEGNLLSDIYKYESFKDYSVSDDAIKELNKLRAISQNFLKESLRMEVK